MAETPSLLVRVLQNLSATLRDSFRIGNELLSGFTVLRKYFKGKDLEDLKAAVKQSEKSHRGEIRIAIESKLSLYQVFSGKTANDRAVEMFSSLKVWDTEENTGILIYLLLSERKIRILADRGIYKHIGQTRLNSIASNIGKGFGLGTPKEALIEGISEITKDLVKFFPARGKNPNELPDEPYIS